MFTLLSPLWEVFSALLGLGVLGGGIQWLRNPPYQVRILHTWEKANHPWGTEKTTENTAGKGNIKVIVGRPWRSAHIIMATLDPRADEFEEELATFVSRAETRAAALNSTRKSLIPGRKRRVKVRH